MEKVLLGKTGLEVSRLGIGLSEIGSSDKDTSKQILHTNGLLKTILMIMVYQNQ